MKLILFTLLGITSGLALYQTHFGKDLYLLIFYASNMIIFQVWFIYYLIADAITMAKDEIIRKGGN